MIKIGLTGNIASGKTTAEKIISDTGFKIIDLDKVSKEIFENNKIVQEKIIKNFQTLDRKKIAGIIFDNKEKRKILEQIIHPELNKEIEKFFIENASEKALFVSGATIFEAGFDKTFEKIILIDAPFSLKLERLMKRDNLKKEEALKRLSAQKNNRDKTKYIIDNDSDIESLEKKIKDVIKLIFREL